jgi:hypothetical protein
MSFVIVIFIITNSIQEEGSFTKETIIIFSLFLPYSEWMEPSSWAQNVFSLIKRPSLFQDSAFSFSPISLVKMKRISIRLLVIENA